MRLLYVYQYYNSPDCPTTARHYRYLHALAARHEITLLTTRAHYDTRLTDDFDWVPEGVDLRMLDVPYRNEMSERERLWAFATFARKAWAEGMRTARPDLVFGTSTPLTAAWVAREIARFRRVPWVFEVRDLWPDFPIQMGAVRRGWMQRMLYGLEHHLYRSAAHVLTLSSDMEAHVRAQGVPTHRVTTLGHGSDFDLLDACDPARLDALRTAHGLTGKKVVLYAGTLGRANAIPTLLATAERLAGHDAVRFVVAGYGYYRPEVEAAAARLPNLVLLPPLPRHQMLCWFRLADLSLVSFIDRPVLATNAPAKFFDSLAAGTPVVVTNPGWTKTFVETHGGGWYVPPEDAGALARRITTVLADDDARRATATRAAQYARAHFDRTQLAQQFEAILEKARGLPSVAAAGC